MSPDKKNNQPNVLWRKPLLGLRVINAMSLTQIPQSDPPITRSKKLEDIFQGKVQETTNVLHFMLGLTGILLSVFFAITMTLWPQHNIIDDPKYWYECMLVIATGYTPIAAGTIVFSCFYSLGTELRKTLKSLLLVYLSGVTTTILLSCFLYVIWVHALDKLYPMPFQGYLVGFCTWHTMTISLWFQIPIQWRNNPELRKRSKFVILLLLVISVTELVYKVIRKTFLVIPENTQWCLFVVLIVVRELHAKMLSSLGKKVAGFDDMSIEVIASHFAACRHTLFLAVALSTVATFTTSLVILATDFFINIGLCLIIMYLGRKTSETARRWRTGMAMNLVINESVEFVIPIAYCICFLMAYYGPNATILGNVKNGYWQYSAVTNINTTIMWIGIMFFIDFGSTIISAFLLFRFCNLNIFKMYLLLQKEMWYVLSVHQCYLVEEVGFIFNIFFQC